LIANPIGQKRKSVTGDLLRFLLAGGLNTLLTLAVFQIALFVTNASIAYAISWIAGILFVVMFYPTRVFPEGRTGPRDRIALGASYVAMFLLGLGLLNVLTWLGMQPRISIVIVLAFTTAANFVASRLLLRR